jgi:adenylate kinase family enzyme
LIIGKPRSGKSTLGRELSKALDLVYIEPETLIKKIIDKVANYQPPEDLEEGQQVTRSITFSHPNT